MEGGREAPAGGRRGGFENGGCGRGVAAFHLGVTHSRSLSGPAYLHKPPRNTAYWDFQKHWRRSFVCDTHKRSHRSPPLFAAILKQLPPLNLRV